MIVKGGELSYWANDLTAYFKVEGVDPQKVAKIKFEDPGDPAFPAERPKCSFELTANTPESESIRMGRKRVQVILLDANDKQLFKSK